MLVFTVNFPESAPAATVTVDGTIATGELDVRLIVSPPVGAGPVRVTVPAEDAGPTTVAGFKTTEAKVGGVMDRVAETVTAATAPDITA